MSLNDERKCAPELAEYYKCLGGNNRDVSHCRKQESTLRQCSSTDQENNYCLDEILRLLNCTRNPNRNGCAKEFVVFRECNRPGGPEIVVKDNMYTVDPRHRSKYNLDSEVICSVYPPKRDKTLIGSMINKMKEACGFKNFQEEFVPKVKS